MNRREFLKTTAAAGALTAVGISPELSKAKEKPKDIVDTCDYTAIPTNTLFDCTFGGLRRSSLYLVTGRVGEGKTVFSQYLAARAIKTNDIKVVFLMSVREDNGRLPRLIGRKPMGKYVIHTLYNPRDFYETAAQAIEHIQPDIVIDDRFPYLSGERSCFTELWKKRSDDYRNLHRLIVEYKVCYVQLIQTMYSPGIGNYIHGGKHQIGCGMSASYLANAIIGVRRENHNHRLVGIYAMKNRWGEQSNIGNPCYNVPISSLLGKYA